MREQHVVTPAGRFTRCFQCNREPRHIIVQGRTLRETMDRSIPAFRHKLECPCLRGTGLHNSLNSAETDWGQRHGQLLLGLHPSATFEAYTATPAPTPTYPPKRRYRSRSELTNG